ncbi:copper-sensing transcriptional repressor CsoR [Bifidobacterium aquikefiri]|uniref:Copper-sensing transcriptional repressor CsoR n=1 Tax=Bifidobacterium aquikefiri TaxID=1653207 RepID=A0A261GC12_9BIFI|nr:copper-sensing transcriptional repressor CsoR [Bifidobacterium aquikefiri]
MDKTRVSNDKTSGGTSHGNIEHGSASHASVGYVKEKTRVVARMKRIEGQVRAITRMIEDETYCIDVLTQIAAADKALKAVALELLDSHLDHCVRSAINQGDEDADEKVHEASAAIARLVRS